MLRETPEFAEIRYRYAQAHIFEGQQALEDGNAEQALNEALLVTRLDEITVKQRRDARRLASEARAALQQPGPSGGQAP